MYEKLFTRNLQATDMLMVLYFAVVSDVLGNMPRISYISGNCITRILVNKNDVN
jgi:hypothetical protein